MVFLSPGFRLDLLASKVVDRTVTRSAPFAADSSNPKLSAFYFSLSCTLSLLLRPEGIPRPRLFSNHLLRKRAPAWSPDRPRAISTWATPVSRATRRAVERERERERGEHNPSRVNSCRTREALICILGSFTTRNASEQSNPTKSPRSKLNFFEIFWNWKIFCILILFNNTARIFFYRIHFYTTQYKHVEFIYK